MIPLLNYYGPLRALGSYFIVLIYDDMLIKLSEILEYPLAE
jgi:hypothetical protein